MTNLTNKDIEFLSNRDLIDILRSVLNELDVVASGGAHRSTTYLAVSAIEGLFGEILTLLRIQPTGGTIPPQWPCKQGKPKALDELTLEDREKILQAASALPSDFENLYGPLRRFQNYMHPARELKNQTPIAQSVAQLALASLNAVIEKYQFRRFVAMQEWTRVYGLAQVPEANVIHMPQNPGENVSILVSELPAERLRRIKFDVVVPPGAVFNFVYNYFSLDQFMAARIEGREGQNSRGWDNGRLVCTKWQAWTISDRYTNDSEPSPRQYQHTVQVTLDPLGTFAMDVDGVQLALDGGVSWDLNPQGKIGFMTESGAVSVKDLALEVR
jgi:hypothetical protein